MLAIRSSSPDSAITKAWDESKHSRRGKGDNRGGEFSPKSGGSVSFVAPAIDDPSGSIERDTSKAIRQLDGERHANQKRIMEDIDAQLGIKSTHVNAVGVWSDGAENSLTIRSEGVDHDTLKYATAIKAQIARQKDAIAFTPDENGNAILYTVSVDSRNITELRKAATESGLEYHTIHEDGKKGSKIIVFDPSGSGELDDIVDKFADKMESYHAERTRGQGEFLTNEYASRSKASAKYDEIIGNYEKVFPTRRHYKGETGPGDSDNRRGESTKGLTVGQAQVARALFTRAADMCGAGTGAAGGFGSGNRCGSLRNTLKKTIHARVNAEFSEDEQEHLTDGMKPKESAPEHIKDRWYAAALSAEVAWYESERDRTKNALAVEEAKPEIKRNAISVLVNHNSPEIDDKFMRIDAVNETRRARRLSSLKRQVESNEKLLATKQKELNAAIVAKDRAEVSRARSSMTQSELHSLDSTDVVLAIDDSKENRDFLAQLLAKSMREQQQETASAIFNRAWDESKYNRQGKGDERGGEFAPKQGGGTAAAGPSAKPSKKEVAPGVRLSASGKHLIDSSGGKTKITSDVRREYAASGTPLPAKPGNAKPAAPAPVAKNKPPARGGINDRGDDAAHTRLQALRKNLPRGFSLTDYEEEIRLPSGDLLQLNGNSNRSVQQLEDALMDRGHDPNDIVQGINSRELREARDAKVAAKQAATTEKWDGPAALAAQQKLTEIKENLPEDFRMSTTNARQVITPDGDYVTLPDNPAEALKVMEDLLNDHGHDPKTFLQDAKLKAIGADFLDNLEPDEDGNLFQKRQSGASYNVENTEPQSWDEVDSHTQNNIEESWRANQQMEIENDSDFYSELRSEAETSADETIDAMDNDEIAAAIHDEIKGMNGFEDFTVEEVEEVLDAGDDKTAQELRDAFVIKHRDELIDKMMEGEFYTEKVSNRINNDEYEMGSDEWFEYAKSNGYLESSEDGGDSQVSDKLDELGLDIDDLTTMMGAPDHWDFNVTYDSEHDGVKCSYEDGRNILIRVFHRNEDGDLAVYNDHFKLDPNAPKGLGLEIFSQAVAACKEQGVVEFKTHAAGSWRNTGPHDYVGFAVWPTFGYSFPVDMLNSDTQSRVAAAYPDAEDVRDIFDQPGGQAWWWKNGSSLYNYEGDETTYAHFDLRDGSRNIAALNSYMGRKKNERKKVRERMAK